MISNILCISSREEDKLISYGVDSRLIKESQIKVENCGESARKLAFASHDLNSVYVISCDDVDSINLAAAIKHDNPKLCVYLVVDAVTGSLKTRTDACGIDNVIEFSELKSTLSRCVPRFDAGSQDSFEQSSCLFEEFDIDEPDFDYSDDCQSIPGFSIEEQNAICEESHRSVNPDCWIMSIFSGSGGAGKSTVSAISAQLFSLLGYKTLLVDCDLQFGDLRNAFKNVNCVSIDQVVTNPEKMEPLTDWHSETLSILQAPRSLESFEIVAPRICELLAQCSNIFDVIVVNTGSCWSDVHANLMKLSSLSLFLIDQRVSSVRGCKHALELADRLNISSQSFKFALNRCGRKSALCAADVEPAFGVSDVFELAEGSLEVEEKMCLGAVLDLVKQRNPLSMSVFEMLKLACPLSIVNANNREKKLAC